MNFQKEDPTNDEQGLAGLGLLLNNTYRLGSDELGKTGGSLKIPRGIQGLLALPSTGVSFRISSMNFQKEDPTNDEQGLAGLGLLLNTTYLLGSDELGKTGGSLKIPRGIKGLLALPSTG